MRWPPPAHGSQGARLWTSRMRMDGPVGEAAGGGLDAEGWEDGPSTVKPQAQPLAGALGWCIPLPLMSSSVCLACGSAGAEPYPTPFPDPIVRCRRCGTRFVHPVPSDRSLRQRYEAEHRTGNGESSSTRATRAIRRARGPAGAPPRRRASGRRLLDIGCGDGRFPRRRRAGRVAAGRDRALAGGRPAGRPPPGGGQSGGGAAARGPDSRR